jgi:hypothetical protein
MWHYISGRRFEMTTRRYAGKGRRCAGRIKVRNHAAQAVLQLSRLEVLFFERHAAR